MRMMEDPSTLTFQLTYHEFSEAKRASTGGGYSTCGPGIMICEVEVDVKAPLSGPLTTLAHEAGGAWAQKQSWFGHADLTTGAIMYENAARRMFGCGGYRNTHDIADGPPPAFCR